MSKKITRRESLKLLGFGAGAVALAACAAPPASAPAATTAPAAGGEATAAPAASGSSNQLEIFSWWTSGGEVEALNALYDIYKKKYPDVEIINAAIAEGVGQGGNMKALLQTRMLGGDPPDSFQVHLGQELLADHVKAGRMADLSELYKTEGFNDVFPKGIIDLASSEGKPYSVPVNIHRSNVMWYNTKHLKEAGLEKAPATWDDWFKYAETLKGKGIGALAVAGSDGNFSAHVFENILVATLGPDRYLGLFNGKTAWDDPDVKKAMEILLKSHEYAQAGYESVKWGDINEIMTTEKASTMIMGDWTHGLFKSAGFKEYHWAPAPGTDGVFVALSDSFGLPKGVKHPENVNNWLKLIGSKDGQDAFNPIKGSIPARSDADLSKYDDYGKETIDAFKTNTIVGSIQHGAAAPQAFVNDFDSTVSQLLASKDVEAAAKQLVEAAKSAGMAM
jgi:glucose/mannose transport system substrate-binding protein